MAKVMVSLPDDLLGALDAEAKRRRTSRSAILQSGARRELGLLRRKRVAVLSELDRVSRAWDGPLDSAALVRAERLAIRSTSPLRIVIPRQRSRASMS